jgi:hypothetical protein
VLDAIGWGKADLYDDRSGATYHYDDAVKVRRYYNKQGEKKFHQDGHINGAPTTLYRQSEVIEAKSRGETILLVEAKMMFAHSNPSESSQPQDDKAPTASTRSMPARFTEPTSSPSLTMTQTERASGSGFQKSSPNSTAKPHHSTSPSQQSARTPATMSQPNSRSTNWCHGAHPNPPTTGKPKSKQSKKNSHASTGTNSGPTKPNRNTSTTPSCQPGG